jgi:hypothetical protein
LVTILNGEHHVTLPNHNPLRIATLSSIPSEIDNHLSKTKEVVEELFS